MNTLSNEERQTLGAVLHARLSTLVQKELRCDDLHASMSGAEDTAWNRFRMAQTEVLNSLQQTNQHLLVDSANEIRAIRDAEARKNEDLRQQLKKEFDTQQARLNAEHEEKQKALAAREEALTKQLAEFETKESKYVARQEAKKQLEQLKEWLKDSSLTEKTVNKRRPVFIGYVVAILATGALTAWLSYENVQILKGAGANLPQVPWWQWIGLTIKTVVPLGAFVTFLVYFIRWEADWARQHSDEELRTRARVVDIGRSSWLIEAVRDSQESKEPLPKELLEQLAKNLFANATGEATDLHPKTGAETLMAQLSSLRLKSPDGAEVEATTAGKK
jgi:flagellar biosynthesis GTPase FlhF